jgi:hypothetical protein
MALSSCSLIGSIARDCRASAGGVIECKVKVLPNASTIAANYTVTSGTVTIAAGSQSGWYTYFLQKNTAVFEQDQKVSAPNGTRAFNQTATIIFNKIQASLDREMNAVGQNAVQIAVWDVNDTYRLFGYEFGMDITSSKDSTGTTKEDRNGYTVQFEGAERVPAPFMSSSTYATLVT